MNQQFIYLIVCLIITSCISTKEVSNDISTFQLKKITVNEIQSIESVNNGREKFTDVTIQQGYFPELNVYEFSQPKLYRRIKDETITEISYYYTTMDSIVRVISYAWNEQDDFESVQNIFDSNKKLFSNYFKNNGKLERKDEPTYWQDAITWENKKILVFQFILGNQKGAYRTRTIIKYK